jgi:hypothetical protein
MKMIVSQWREYLLGPENGREREFSLPPSLAIEPERKSLCFQEETETTL